MNKPIRILQVVTYMGRGGLETMLMNYYRHIDRDLVQFDFLTHRNFRADYDDEIESLGGRIYRLPRLVPWSPAYHKALNEFFSKHPEYRIVHVHQDCLSSIILKIAKKNGVPVRIAHSHSSSQEKDLKYPIKLFCKKFIPRYATDLYACGQKAGEWMFNGKPFHILNNAIDATSYRYKAEIAESVRQRLGVSEDALVIGHVGRFSYPKNHVLLIDIFSEVHRRKPNTYLLLVGGGDLCPKVEDKVKSLGLENYVIFAGVRSDVPLLMQAMDIFVLPSLYEGLPVTMIEAQASGLPCFISDKVPLECKKTGLVTRISLQTPAEQWAEQILAARNTERKDTYAQIAAAGFDIVENARWLQNFYLEQWKAHE